MYIELWDKSSYVPGTTHVSVSVVQPTVICSHASFGHLMCMFLLMVSLPIFCDNTVFMNEAIV